MKKLLDQLRVVLEKNEARIHELVGKCDELEQENDKLHKELEDYVFSTTCLLYTSPSPRDQRGSGIAG